MNTATGYNRFKDKVGQCSKEKEKKEKETIKGIKLARKIQ